MYHRFRDQTVHNNVYYFAGQAGVTFCIHVYYTEDGVKKVTALAPPLNKTSLLGVASREHPDQLYLALDAVTTKLALLTDVTVTKVEVDDTISFCGTGDGQCGKVVPDWVRTKFPDVPASLFVHKSDVVGRTLSGQHYYDLYDSSVHDSWDWVEIEPIAIVPVLRYVAVYTCKQGGCTNKHKEMTLIEVSKAGANGRGGFMALGKAKAKCNGTFGGRACNREYEYYHTRAKAPADRPAVTLD